MVRVVFIHPDLGIGGAERLVVDAAVALKSKGCSVQIWTAHYDPSHCFSETLDPDLPVVHQHTDCSKSQAAIIGCLWVTWLDWSYFLNRCVWVTGYPPVCLATCMRSVPTWGWSTWLSICSSSAGWNMTSSSVIRWVRQPNNRLPDCLIFLCEPLGCVTCNIMDHIVNICLCGCLTSLSCVTPLNYSQISHWDNDSIVSFVFHNKHLFYTLVVFQVSACIPVLRLSRQRKKVLFYCHFPDQLLTQRKSALKRLYRAPLDWLEERTTGMADMVCSEAGVMNHSMGRSLRDPDCRLVSEVGCSVSSSFGSRLVE